LNQVVDEGRRSTFGVLERGLAVIDIVTRASGPLSLTAIADAAHLDPSSALRILKTLARAEYVVRVPATKMYLPGPRALVPLSLFHPLAVLRREAAGTIDALQRSLDLAVALVLFVGSFRLVLEQRHGGNRLTPFYETIIRSPLHLSATGKQLLLTMTFDERSAILDDEPLAPPVTGAPITRDDVETDLSVSLERGYTVAQDETFAGLSSVAAPVGAQNARPIGCIGAFGQSSHLKGNAMSLAGRSVMDAAHFLGRMCPAVKDVGQLLGTPR
jgi:DNA-binding IclR family transcriptional regulator